MTKRITLENFEVVLRKGNNLAAITFNWNDVHPIKDLLGHSEKGFMSMYADGEDVIVESDEASIVLKGLASEQSQESVDMLREAPNVVCCGMSDSGIVWATNIIREDFAIQHGFKP